jgi:hypothetical protein
MTTIADIDNWIAGGHDAIATEANRVFLEPAKFLEIMRDFKAVIEQRDTFEIETKKQRELLMFAETTRRSLQPEAIERIQKAERETRELKAAIRRHRDIGDDERCRFDDIELYRVLGEPIPDAVLPDEPRFLASCKRYWELRRTTGCSHNDMPTLAEQEAEIQRLRGIIERMGAAIRDERQDVEHRVEAIRRAMTDVVLEVQDRDA